MGKQTDIHIFWLLTLINPIYYENLLYIPGLLSEYRESKQTVSVGLGLVQSCLGSSESLLMHSAILFTYELQ